MLLIRWSRLALRGVPLLIGLMLAVTGPALLLLALIQPGYLVAGAACAAPVSVGAAWSVALSRHAVMAVAGLAPVPATPDEVQAVAAAARAARIPPPTLLVPPGGLQRPVTFRGLRRCFTLAMPTHLAQPGLLVEQVRRDRRTGDDRLAMWVVAVVGAYAVWSGALHLVTTSVRRRGPVDPWSRLKMLTRLPLALLVAPGWALAWVGMQLTLLVAPRWFVDVLLDRTGSARFVRRKQWEDVVSLGPDWQDPSMQLASATLAPPRTRARARLRTWWSTPAALGSSVRDGVVESGVRVVVGVLVLGIGTFAGWGRLPAERVVWPWEAGPVIATVQTVSVDAAEGESLFGLLGLDIATEYEATVRTDDGRRLLLRPGTSPLEAGDRVRVVPSGEAGGRWPGQDSLLDIAVSGLIFVAGAAGVLRVVGGPFTMSYQRRLVLADHDQRVATGRRHRRTRPRPWLGVDAG